MTTRKRRAPIGYQGPITAADFGIVCLTLPFPPSLNHLYATVRGRRVLSAAGRQYKQDVFLAACQQGAARELLKGELRVELRFFRPRRSGDLDNLLKALLDSLTGICWKDDSQIVGIEAHRLEDKAHPRVDVRVMPSPLLTEKGDEQG